MVLTTGSFAGSKKLQAPARVIVAEACLLKAHDEEKLRHAEVGEELLASPEDAASAVGAGRAYYLSAADDPTKGGLTATPNIRMAIAHRAESIARRRAEQEAQPLSSGLISQQAAIDEAVAKAVAKALAPGAQRSF